jgi:hypothetical protein
MSLLFSVAELTRESVALREVARDYLEPGADAVLRTVERDLEDIARRNGDRCYDWGIREYSPLRTKSSAGQYMPDDEGSLEVYGEITFVWQLQPIRPSAKRPAANVRLDGKASTLVRLLEGAPNSGDTSEELAVWRMEVADDRAPGAYFHVQILGREKDKVFPHALDVPRLPNALVSPFACAEFVLGELFQDDWARHADRDFQAIRQWRGVQAHRHQRQLEWHQNQVRAAAGSPWLAWKKALPPENIFLR